VGERLACDDVLWHTYLAMPDVESRRYSARRLTWSSIELSSPHTAPPAPPAPLAVPAPPAVVPAPPAVVPAPPAPPAAPAPPAPPAELRAEK
jgi:hypothetical protein